MRLTPEEEVRLAKESERGAKARAVLSDSMFMEAVSAVETDTLEKWKTCPVRDAEGQLVLRLKWQIMQEIKGHLADVMMTGKMAEATLEARRALVERAKSVISGMFRR